MHLPIHPFPSIGIVEEVPIPKNWISEHFGCHVIDHIK